MKDLYRRLKRGAYNFYQREFRGNHPLKEAQRYKRDGGVRILTRFPLHPADIVLDIGGHVGGFAADIHAATGASVHVFEPVLKFHEHCERRFADNPKIHCHAYGLGAVDGRFAISDANEASSLHAAAGADAEMVEVRQASAAIDSLGIADIGLIKMNIEGAEYDVLPALLDAGIVARSRFLLIQFHTVGNYAANREALRARIAETHDEMWCYDFVWEAWRARP
jgi:FkbM family methyltransferase